jgi:hypothetical protein
MTDVMTKDATAIVDAYFAMWNEEDTATRARHIEEAWTDSGRYVDPARDAQGHAALNEMVSEARPHFPGPHGPPYERHRRAPRPAPLRLAGRRPRR